MATYRVELVHKDNDHPNGAVSHYGPAIDDGYVTTASQILGENTDHLAEAGKVAKRAGSEYPAKDGFTVKVVQLTDDGWTEVK